MSNFCEKRVFAFAKKPMMSPNSDMPAIKTKSIMSFQFSTPKSNKENVRVQILIANISTKWFSILIYAWYRRVMENAVFSVCVLKKEQKMMMVT